ncbi:MAG: Gfo/Idh/MocA family oxidoreductase [bacterium]|nr:Gfo/Idh/MocA family oxidoreductase [bacterium]
MDPLRVGIIGAGGHAQSHFAMIASEPEMDLIAVAELDPDRLAKAQQQHHPQSGFSDYREMLDNCNLDVVYVETMPGHGTAIVLDCLERGLHTSVEKPVGMSSREAEQMLAASRKSAGKAIVSVNRRYMPEVLAVKNLVLDRGGAVHVAATYNKPLTRLGIGEMADITPLPLICDAIHHVDLIRWLAGPTLETAADPMTVYADCWQGDREGSYRHNATVTFHTGCRGVMMSHYGVGTRIQRAECHAEDFSAYLDLTGRGKVCELYENGQAYTQPLDLDAVGGPHFNETRHFVTCIREDRTPWSNLEDLVKTMKFCEVIVEGVKGTV